MTDLPGPVAATRVHVEPAIGADALDGVMRTMAAAFDPAFGEAWTRSQCEGILGLPGVWLTVARRDPGGDGGNGGAGPADVGFALARVILDEAELLLLAVVPGARRHGTGTSLLDAVSAAAHARGAARIHLEMREGNPARALYDGAGFVEIGRRRGYYRGGDGRRIDAVTLSRELGATRRGAGRADKP